MEETDSDSVPLLHTVGLPVGEALPDTLWLLLCVPVAHWEPEAHCEALGEALAHALSVPEAHCDCPRVALAQGLPLAEAEAHAPAVAVVQADADAEALAAGEREAAGLGECVTDGLGEGEGAALPLGEGRAEEDTACAARARGRSSRASGCAAGGRGALRWGAAGALPWLLLLVGSMERIRVSVSDTQASARAASTKTTSLMEGRSFNALLAPGGRGSELKRPNIIGQVGQFHMNKNTYFYFCATIRSKARAAPRAHL